MPRSNQATIPESDVITHLQDTAFYWTFRHGKQCRLTWNELTSTEKRYQREAAERAAYRAMFAPDGGATC